MEDLLQFFVIGIVAGAIYAVAASGLVVTYTTSGIFNFAHGAIGMFMAFVYWELRVNQGWPAPIALVLVLFVLSPLMGAAIERILMRRLYQAPLGVSIVVTLALLVILLRTGQAIWNPNEARQLRPFFGNETVSVLGVNVSYHQILVLATAAAIAGGLRLLMFHTRAGVTMRAVVDNRDLAGLNGVYPERVAQMSWALGSVLAAIAGILIAPNINSMSHLDLTLLVVNGYAAAMLGKLRNLPLTFVGALAIGLIQAYVIGYGGDIRIGDSFRLIDATQVIPTVFLFFIVVFMPQVRLSVGRIVGASAPRVPSLRSSLIASAALVVGMGVASSFMSEFWLYNFSMTMVIGIVMLSLVLLSGYAGQISLMQMTFVGIGVLAISRIGGNGSLAGILIAGAVSAAFGAIVAVPALRLQPLYLALVTLAVALFADWAFNQPWLFGRGGTITLDRLDVFGFTFRSEQSQLLLVTIAFALFGLLVLAIRRGPYGRRLAALRDSPTAASMLGMNLVTTKTAVFAISAGIAGVAGALFGGLRVTSSPFDFAMLQSLFVFLIATVGGITTVIGALLGGFFLAIMPELSKHLPFQNGDGIGIGIAAISLAMNPHGTGGSIAHAGAALRKAFGKKRPPATVAPKAREPKMAGVA